MINRKITYTTVPNSTSILIRPCNRLSIYKLCKLAICYNFLNDVPETWQMTFQDPATIVMEGISDLHHDIMYFIVLISAFAFWMIFITVYTYRFNSYLQPYSQFWKKYLV